ncbi:MAG: V-type ATP synthase subunit E [Clostridiales bacterium]|nr:V-type ATP synthase subunit E [Clostridiales bacterium]
MQGIEKITSRIRSDAQAEIDAILVKARADADAITAKGDAEARRAYEDLTRKGQAAAQEREEHLASSAQMEARKMTLAAKQEMLDAAFGLALQQLRGLDAAANTDLLANLAVRASSTGAEQVILSAKDRDACGAQVVAQANRQLKAAGKSAKLTLSDKAGAFEGGLLLSDGDVEVNCTFETLVRLTRSELAGQVAEVLFD